MRAPVVGIEYFQPTADGLLGSAGTWDAAAVDREGLLVAEPTNEIDASAVRVEADGRLIGYLSARWRDLKRHVHDHGSVPVTIRVERTGGRVGRSTTYNAVVLDAAGFDAATFEPGPSSTPSSTPMEPVPAPIPARHSSQVRWWFPLKILAIAAPIAILVSLFTGGESHFVVVLGLVAVAWALWEIRSDVISGRERMNEP